MTPPIPPSDEKPKDFSLAMLLSLLLGDPTTLVPENEYGAITLSLREWIALTSTCYGALNVMKRVHPQIVNDPVVARGMAAFEKLNAKFDELNRAAAERNAAARNPTP